MRFPVDMTMLIDTDLGGGGDEREVEDKSSAVPAIYCTYSTIA